MKQERVLTLTRAEAEALLNEVMPVYENALSIKLGPYDLPYSDERAALVSLIFNVGIYEAMPSLLAALRSAPISDLAAYEQRASAWYEIVYASNEDSTAGIQNRRINEGNLFGLFTDDGSPRDFQEATHGYQFLDRKNGVRDETGTLHEYLTGNGYSQQRADDTVASHYQPAFEYIVAELGGQQSFTDYRQVIVDQADTDADLSQSTQIENANTIILAMDGDDTVRWSTGFDFLNGGDENAGDTLDLTGITDVVSIDYIDGTSFPGTDRMTFFVAPEDLSWHTLFTDFETVRVSATVTLSPGEAGDLTLQKLSEDGVKLVDVEADGTLDFGLLTADLVIDLDQGIAKASDSQSALEIVQFVNAIGGEGNDILTGDDQANAINGHVGADTLSGGGDDDFIFFDAADGANVNGGAGRDVAVALGQDGVTVDMTAQALEVCIGGGGADVITVGEAEGGLCAAGGDGSDTFVVTNGDGFIEGGPRVLWGGSGADTFEFEWASSAQGIAVVQIAGLTEEIFSSLTLADLGLGNLDLSMFQAIILNPDQDDRFLYDGDVFSSELHVEIDGYSASVRSHVSAFITEALGRSLSVQGLYQDNYVIETTPGFEWDDMENITSISRFTGAFDGASEAIYVVTDYDPLDNADQAEATELYDYYGTHTDQVIVQVATAPQYSAFWNSALWVVGGTFSEEALSANGQLAAGPLSDPGTTPFDWLLVA